MSPLHTASQQVAPPTFAHPWEFYALRPFIRWSFPASGATVLCVQDLNTSTSCSMFCVNALAFVVGARCVCLLASGAVGWIRALD